MLSLCSPQPQRPCIVFVGHGQQQLLLLFSLSATTFSFTKVGQYCCLYSRRINSSYSRILHHHHHHHHSPRESFPFDAQRSLQQRLQQQVLLTTAADAAAAATVDAVTEWPSSPFHWQPLRVAFFTGRSLSSVFKQQHNTRLLLQYPFRAITFPLLNTFRCSFDFWCSS